MEGPGGTPRGRSDCWNSPVEGPTVGTALWKVRLLEQPCGRSDCWNSPVEGPTVGTSLWKTRSLNSPVKGLNIETHISKYSFTVHPVHPDSFIFRTQHSLNRSSHGNCATL